MLRESSNDIGRHRSAEKAHKRLGPSAQRRLARREAKREIIRLAAERHNAWLDQDTAKVTKLTAALEIWFARLRRASDAPIDDFRGMTSRLRSLPPKTAAPANVPGRWRTRA